MMGVLTTLYAPKTPHNRNSPVPALAGVRHFDSSIYRSPVGEYKATFKSQFRALACNTVKVTQMRTLTVPANLRIPFDEEVTC